MKDINQHIQKDKDILDDATISPQMRRHIESELEQLEAYKNNHPDATEDPSALELFCDSNPHEPECRIYEN